MTPLVAAVVSLALPVIVLELLAATLWVGAGQKWALSLAAVLAVPSVLAFFALSSLGLYHLLVQSP
jgi:hypothetical protein